MQMTDKGIICTGYLFNNPSEENVGTFSGSGYESEVTKHSTSSAPSIGHRLCFTAKNTGGGYSTNIEVTFTSGTYVSINSYGTYTGVTDREYVQPYESRYVRTTYVRYA